MKNNDYREAHGPDTVTALVTGAVIGAAAVVLSKKENRQKISRKFSDFLEMGENKMNDVQDSIQDLKEKGKKTLANGVDKVSEKLEEAEAKAKKATGRA
jgi:gas vesicle protein